MEPISSTIINNTAITSNTDNKPTISANQNISNSVSTLSESATDSTQPLGGKLWNIFFTPAAPKAPVATLNASVTSDNNVTVSTADGYKISISTKDAEWKITGPDNKTTRIFGDPHVEESDGDKWDFINQSSFIFGDNKVTVETKDLGNGTSVSKTVSIYNGTDRLTITGIDINQPKIVDWKFDAREHDIKLSDGDNYRLESTPNGRTQWTKS